MDQLPGEVLWTRLPLRESTLGEYAGPRWHRFLERIDGAIVTACHRRLPLASPVLPQVPDGGRPCQFCNRPPVVSAGQR